MCTGLEPKSQSDGLVAETKSNPLERRFAFYDQIHTTGMDIKHVVNATAVLTLGKDMVFRDYVQGAYRMRGIGTGQRIHVMIIPEVAELMQREENAAIRTANLALEDEVDEQSSTFVNIEASRSAESVGDKKVNRTTEIDYLKAASTSNASTLSHHASRQKQRCLRLNH
jgi:hypothetical protein